MLSGLSVPSLTTEQMREVDRLMVEEYGIALLQMMENAGRNLAGLAARLSGGAAGGRFLVLCGGGNNGGGGMAAARHLHNMGARVRALLGGPVGDLVDAPARQASTLLAMGVELLEATTIPAARLSRALGEADLVVDALVGYGLAGAPRGAVAGLIERTSAAGQRVVSLDVPSGIDANSGTVHEPSMRAAATLTLALPKNGLGMPGVRNRLGELYLGDISVPPELYGRLGSAVPPLFGEAPVVRLRWTDGGWVTEE